MGKNVVASYLYGCVPNLPWQRLQRMSDADIQAYNRSFLVEIEMKPDAIKAALDDTRAKYRIAEALERDIWNAAIEAAADLMDSQTENISDNYAAQIRKLKK